MKNIAAAFGLLVALAACSTEQLPPPAPVSHALPPKISLDVQAINLADRSGLQPANSPYNGNHFTPTIADAIKQWAQDRLQAVGQSGQAIIVIKDASLVAQSMPVKEGVDTWLTRQQGVKYVGRADVSIEATGAEGFAVADASAVRALTLPENPTAMEKQNAYYTMLNDLMGDLGRNLDTAIQSHMSKFIITAPVLGVTAVPTGAIPLPASVMTFTEQPPAAPVQIQAASQTQDVASASPAMMGVAAMPIEQSPQPAPVPPAAAPLPAPALAPAPAVPAPMLASAAASAPVPLTSAPSVMVMAPPAANPPAQDSAPTPCAQTRTVIPLSGPGCQ